LRSSSRLGCTRLRLRFARGAGDLLLVNLRELATADAAGEHVVAVAEYFIAKAELEVAKGEGVHSVAP
jgi:hypothetical protein